MFKTPEGLITFNAFELKSTPTIVVVFVTLLQSTSLLGLDPSPEQLKETVGDYSSLLPLPSRTKATWIKRGA